MTTMNARANSAPASRKDMKRKTGKKMSPYNLRNPYLHDIEEQEREKEMDLSKKNYKTAAQVMQHERSRSPSPPNVGMDQIPLHYEAFTHHSPVEIMVPVPATIYKGVSRATTPDPFSHTFDKASSDYRIDVLTKYYKKAKKWGAKLYSGPTPSSIPLKQRQQTAAKIYQAMSSLLYCSMSSAKANDIEEFIRRKAVAIPSSLFDCSKWDDVIELARDVRLQHLQRQFEQSLGYRTQQMLGQGYTQTLGPDGFPVGMMQMHMVRPNTTGHGVPVHTDYMVAGGSLFNENETDEDCLPPQQHSNNNWFPSPGGGGNAICRLGPQINSLSGAFHAARQSVAQDLRIFSDCLASAREQLVPVIAAFLQTHRDELDHKDMLLEKLTLDMEARPHLGSQGNVAAAAAAAAAAEGRADREALVASLQEQLSRHQEQHAQYASRQSEQEEKVSAAEALVEALTKVLRGMLADHPAHALKASDMESHVRKAGAHLTAHAHAAVDMERIYEVADKLSVPLQSPHISTKASALQAELAQVTQRARAACTAAETAELQASTALSELQALRAEHSRLGEQLRTKAQAVEQGQRQLALSQQAVARLEKERETDSEQLQELERQCSSWKIRHDELELRLLPHTSAHSLTASHVVHGALSAGLHISSRPTSPEPAAASDQVDRRGLDAEMQQLKRRLVSLTGDLSAAREAELQVHMRNMKLQEGLTAAERERDQLRKELHHSQVAVHDRKHFMVNPNESSSTTAHGMARTLGVTRAAGKMKHALVSEKARALTRQFMESSTARATLRHVDKRHTEYKLDLQNSLEAVKKQVKQLQSQLDEANRNLSRKELIGKSLSKPQDVHVDTSNADNNGASPGPEAQFGVGDHVTANFRKSGEWYPGKVKAVHRTDGTYDVDYDDGDFEANVLKQDLRVRTMTETARAQDSPGKTAALRQQVNDLQSELNLMELNMRAKSNDYDKTLKEYVKEFDEAQTALETSEKTRKAAETSVERLQKELAETHAHHRQIHQASQKQLDSLKQELSKAVHKHYAAEVVVNAISSPVLSHKSLQLAASPDQKAAAPPNAQDLVNAAPSNDANDAKRVLQAVAAKCRWVAKTLGVASSEGPHVSEAEVGTADASLAAGAPEILSILSQMEALNPLQANQQLLERTRQLELQLSSLQEKVSLAEKAESAARSKLVDVETALADQGQSNDKMRNKVETAERRANLLEVQRCDLENGLEHSREELGALRKKLAAAVAAQNSGHKPLIAGGRGSVVHSSENSDDGRGQVPRDLASELGEAAADPEDSRRGSAASVPAAASAAEGPEATTEGGARVSDPTSADAGQLKAYNFSAAQAAVHMQRMIRGFLASRYVEMLLNEKATKHQGILVAYRLSGTQQGEAGWYICNDRLYYFAIDNGEYVQLSGPMTQDDYDKALQDCLDEGVDPQSGDQGERIQLDRLGLMSVRNETANLRCAITELRSELHEHENKQLQLRDNIAALESAVAEVKTDLAAEKRLVLKLQHIQQDKDAQLAELRIELRAERDAKHSTSTTELHSQIDSLGIDEDAEKQILLTARSEKIRKSVVAKLGEHLGSSKFTAAIIKAQSYVRRYLVGKRVHLLKQYKEATARGILVAMQGTQQGQSGWYRAPDEAIYYFVNSRNDWVMGAGPLTPAEYKELMFGPIEVGWDGLPKRGNQPLKRVRRYKNVTKGVLKVDVPGKVLCRAPVEVAIEHPDVNNDIFVDKSTQKLFFAISMDTLVSKSSF